MTLSFKTELNGQRTRFMEKIIKCLLWTNPIDSKFSGAINHPDFDTKDLQILSPKLHTIRQDDQGRWKVGMDIHFVIHNRSPKRFQFLDVVPVRSIQQIEIRYSRNQEFTKAEILIDGKRIGGASWRHCQLYYVSKTISRLAENDGFENVNDFFEYFSEDFRGILIHWTDKVY